MAQYGAHVTVATQFLTIIMSTEQSSPTIETTVLESAVDIQVFNSDGGIVRFGDIFTDQKTIVVFIRTHTNPVYSCIFLLTTLID